MLIEYVYEFCLRETDVTDGNRIQWNSEVNVVDRSSQPTLKLDVQNNAVLGISCSWNCDDRD